MLWIKAVHVIAVIAFMAGILYLFRLFVYHVEEPEAVVQQRLAKWEDLLMRRIATPAMVVMVATGLGQLIPNWAFYGHQPWMIAKLVCVVGLLGSYHAASRIRKNLLTDPHAYKGKSMRMLNELPTLLMMAIVVFVIVKPWLH